MQPTFFVDGITGRIWAIVVTEHDGRPTQDDLTYHTRRRHVALIIHDGDFDVLECTSYRITSALVIFFLENRSNRACFGEPILVENLHARNAGFHRASVVCGQNSTAYIPSSHGADIELLCQRMKHEFARERRWHKGVGHPLLRDHSENFFGGILFKEGCCCTEI
ncbi:hypothetical protein D3C85_1148090 [compost metagenome]